MKFAKVLSRSGQSLLAARARGITLVEDEEEIKKKGQFNRCPLLLGP